MVLFWYNTYIAQLVGVVKLYFILILFFFLSPLSAFALEFAEITGGAFGNNSISGIYAGHSTCWSCPYVIQIIDLFSTISVSIYKDLAPAMIILLGVTLVGYIVYKMITGFFGLSMPTATNLLEDLAPKFFALIIVVPILLMPTPKFIYNYMVEPLIGLGAGYGNKMMEVVAGSDVKSYCLLQYMESDNTASQDSAFSANFRQKVICSVSQSHQVNAIGLSLGNALLIGAYKTENLKSGFLPKFGMVASGIIIFLAYFVSLILYPLLLIGALFELGFILAFLPFILFSFVVTRGKEKVPFLDGAFGAGISHLTKASMMFLFLPFMLSISHMIFQTGLGMESIGYKQLVESIQKGDIDKIGEILEFGSKDMLFLAFIGILNGYLLSNTKNIAKWFGVEYDNRLVQWTNNSFKKVTEKGRSGWASIKKWRGNKK